jgi:hypothetical protein
MGSIELDQLRAELEDLHGITSGVLSRIDALRETALTMEPVAFGEAIEGVMDGDGNQLHAGDCVKVTDSCTYGEFQTVVAGRAPYMAGHRNPRVRVPAEGNPGYTAGSSRVYRTGEQVTEDAFAALSK